LSIAAGDQYCLYAVSAIRSYVRREGLAVGILAAGFTALVTLSLPVIGLGALVGMVLGFPVYRGLVQWYWATGTFLLFLCLLEVWR
jgi:hypothetical protein